MKLNHTTNGLLLVIAVCLVLITMRLYDLSVVTSAYAQWSGSSLVSGSSVPIPVALYAKNANGQWYPCQISNGDKLLVEIAK